MTSEVSWVTIVAVYMMADVLPTGKAFMSNRRAWFGSAVLFLFTLRLSLGGSQPAFTSPEQSSGVAWTSLQEPLKYKLLHTNIFCWYDGECQGLVPSNKQGAMAKALESFMQKTQESLQLAIYGIHNQDWFLRLLSKLADQGLPIRAVVDQSDGASNEWIPDNFTYRDTYQLPKAIGENHVVPDSNQDGSPRVGTIMHNKFLVRDRQAIWFASANISHTCLGSEYNANNALIIESAQVAQFFEDEFRQMYSQRRFSSQKAQNGQQKGIRFSDQSTLEVFFAPQDAPLVTAVVPAIEASKEEIAIAMFYLTDKNIEKALIRAHERGVSVRVLLDATAAAHPSSIHRSLRSAGIRVLVENMGGKMHMKTAVIDGRHLLIGSMNWTKSGDRSNDESLIVIKNHPKLAGESLQYMQQLWRALSKNRLSNLSAKSDPRAESHDSVNSCVDGIDNDHDGKIDSEDSGCRQSGFNPNL